MQSFVTLLLCGTLVCLRNMYKAPTQNTNNALVLYSLFVYFVYKKEQLFHTLKASGLGEKNVCIPFLAGNRVPYLCLSVG